MTNRGDNPTMQRFWRWFPAGCMTVAMISMAHGDSPVAASFVGWSAGVVFALAFVREVQGI